MVRGPKIHCHFLKIRGSLSHIYFPGVSDGNESACNAGDPGSIPGLGRSPGEGNGHPLQCSSLEKSLERGAWWDTVRRVTKSRTWLSDSTIIHGSVTKPEPRNPHLLKCEPTGLFIYLFLFFLLQLYYIELAQNFVWVFPLHRMEKPEWTFWPTL